MDNLNYSIDLGFIIIYCVASGQNPYVLLRDKCPKEHISETLSILTNAGLVKFHSPEFVLTQPANTIPLTKIMDIYNLPGCFVNFVPDVSASGKSIPRFFPDIPGFAGFGNRSDIEGVTLQEVLDNHKVDFKA